MTAGILFKGAEIIGNIKNAGQTEYSRAVDNYTKTASKEFSYDSTSKSDNSPTKNKIVKISIDNKGILGVPTELTGYTRHGINQSISHDDVGVSPKAILDTLKHPSKIEVMANGTYKFISEKANIVLNKTGKIITAFSKSSKWWR